MNEKLCQMQLNLDLKYQLQKIACDNKLLAEQYEQLQDKHKNLQDVFNQQQTIISEQSELLNKVQKQKQKFKLQLEQINDPSLISNKDYQMYVQYHNFVKMLQNIKVSIPQIFKFKQQALNTSLNRLLQSVTRVNKSVIQKIYQLNQYRLSSNIIITQQQEKIDQLISKIDQLQNQDQLTQQKLQSLENRSLLNEKLVQKLLCELHSQINYGENNAAILNQQQKEDKLLNEKIVLNIQSQLAANLSFQQSVSNKDTNISDKYKQQLLNMTVQKDILINLVQKLFAKQQQ
ncbi:hypothetical protein SS50377_25547 [Spironucleus salmonicida]|uniref:Uncharacterized protein n=1 Tax=Spironucleus salmonicida TaxID=348837 RepID=V6LN11_9EUKA|nr:hypothetical protein SS50377_25547 [Spironucleus salmonicida]|eukprot:EST45096.1 Hypothetical protein SS50377_15116 [Spironucleus salmonicida]